MKFFFFIGDSLNVNFVLVANASFVDILFCV